MCATETSKDSTWLCQASHQRVLRAKPEAVTWMSAAFSCVTVPGGPHGPSPLSKVSTHSKSKWQETGTQQESHHHLQDRKHKHWQETLHVPCTPSLTSILHGSSLSWVVTSVFSIYWVPNIFGTIRSGTQETSLCPYLQGNKHGEVLVKEQVMDCSISDLTCFSPHTRLGRILTQDPFPGISDNNF